MSIKMIVLDEEGNDIECNIVAKWKTNETDYIAYTDGTRKDGKKELFISKIEQQGKIFKLRKILDDAEWNAANEFLKVNFFESGEEDD